MDPEYALDKDISLRISPADNLWAVTGSSLKLTV